MFDADSRSGARILYRKLKLNWVFSTSTFIGNFLITLLVTYFFSKIGYDAQVNFVFFISILAIGLWISEALPPFAVGIFIIATLLLGFSTDFFFDKTMPAELYVSTWTSNVIWLLLGGFFLAKAMSIVELDQQLFQFTVKKFGQKPERLLLGLMLTTAVASMIMSNTATTAMIISSIIPLVRLIGKNAPYGKALLTAIPASASVGGIGTIIGSTPNAIAVGALQEKGISITFMDWMVVGFPTGLLLVWLFWKFLCRTQDFSDVKLDLSLLPKGEGNVGSFEKYAVIVTLIVTVLMWLTEPLHGIPVAATSAIPIVLLTMTQVIHSEHVRSLPWDTLMLVAGGLALGIALVEVGLAEIVMRKINALPLPKVFIAIIFCLVAVLLSNVMSNTAAASILVPLSLALPGIYGIAGPVMVAISCSCSLLLPVSTPANAIAFATGMVEQKDFRTGGLFYIILGPIVAFSAVMAWVLLFH
ncbi:DASS family sodium-coupled anion symporter [uncultured Cyclobacterium sp.]|uniref:SLC13 family permease n=1 Tax=uncultured Cyclobacterium sp. TaxID=453820 RepID=UPI0030EDDCDD|tara:strand:- start:60296 stop:61714 length:1419 start_codon:yes stop_codon:yes gene_type:complete